MPALYRPGPALARKIWESMERPSARRVAQRLTQSGSPLSHETVNRWRRSGWRNVERRPHPLDAARGALDDAVPVLIDDPLATTSTVTAQSPELASLQELTESQLVRRAARELLQGIAVISRGLLHREELLLSRPMAMAIMFRALADSIRVATEALASRKADSDPAAVNAEQNSAPNLRQTANQAP